MSPGEILMLLIVRESITTFDSKLAKKEGWFVIFDPFCILIFPLIIATIDILDTATDLM